MRDAHVHAGASSSSGTGSGHPTIVLRAAADSMRLFHRFGVIFRDIQRPRQARTQAFYGFMRFQVVNRFSLSASCFLLMVLTQCAAQKVSTNIETMKSAYVGSGSIIALNENSIVIEPKMPSPVCALPLNKDGKTAWSFYTFPLASITVPLDQVDETLLAEDRVFTDPEVAQKYKPGQVGETTMVVISVVPGKHFHTLTYDREKLARLGPGPHSSSQYGQTADDTEAFGLTFADPAAARTFELALKEAVIAVKLEKSKMARQ